MSAEFLKLFNNQARTFNRFNLILRLVFCDAFRGHHPRRRPRRHRPRRRPRRRRRHRPLHRLCGASPSREAVTAQQAARQQSPTSCRAPPPLVRRTTKRTARPTGSSGIQNAVAAVESLVGFSITTRPARLRPVTSTGTGAVASSRTLDPTTHPRLRASPRGVHGAAGRGGTRR